MEQITMNDDLVGKTIERVIDDYEKMIVLFDDATFARFESSDS